MRRCIPLWFYPLALTGAIIAYALGALLKPKPEVTLIFETYYQDGKPAVKSPVFCLNSDPRGPVDLTKRPEMTRPVGYEMEFILSSSNQERIDSPSNIRVIVRWRSRDEYLRWLENDFLAENNLEKAKWRPVIQRLMDYARGGKQIYPIIVPNPSHDFWKNTGKK